MRQGAASLHLAFFRAASWNGGKLLVGLLTDVFRRQLTAIANAYPPPSQLNHYDRQ